MPKTALEAVSYGKKVAALVGGDVNVITFGKGDAAALQGLGAYGAAKVMQQSGLENPDSQQLTKLVVQAAQQCGAKAIIFSHDLVGRAVAPRVAARLSAGLVSGAVDYPKNDGGFTVKVNLFSGKAFGEVKVNSDVKVISLLPNALAPESGSGSASIEEVNFDTGAVKVTVKSVNKNEGEIALPEAELVVSAGRGMKGPENWGMIEELAKELGAATACSRPVADIGWRPHHEHVGQTGLAVAPNLYIAIGISGAIQHLAGVNRSKCIVVVNSDPEAPFFKAADYGIVGDAFQVVPKLIEAVKQFKASQN